MSTTTAPDAPSTADRPIDVVLDGRDLFQPDESFRWTWTLSVDDEPVASGTVHGDRGDRTAASPMALLARDLDAPSGARVRLDLDSSLSTLSSTCTTPVPPEADPVLVVDPTIRACQGVWSDEPPPPTVPPEWSLRPLATLCLGQPRDSRWGQCLADATLAGNEVAEWSVEDGDVLTTYRVEAGELTVVRRTSAGDGVTWTRETCTGFFPSADGRSIAPEACGPEEPMALEP